MILSDKWQDYELIDASDGERLERWGKYILVRPDPQVIWKNAKKSPLWRSADAEYSRSRSGGGSWSKNTLPESWEIGYGDLRFKLKAMNFKHTGLFPEQAANWDYLRELIASRHTEVRTLNLFAYTGGASIACAAAGAKVCHVDAAKGMVAHAKENAALSGLSEKPIRYIVDDCKKFIEREIRRNSKYEIIILDPPSYGRGPSGELWKLEDCVDELLTLCFSLLSEHPLAVVYNSYTTGLSASSVAALLSVNARRAGYENFGIFADEIGLPITAQKTALPCGAVARLEFYGNK